MHEILDLESQSGTRSAERVFGGFVDALQYLGFPAAVLCAVENAFG